MTNISEIVGMDHDGELELHERGRKVERASQAELTRNRVEQALDRVDANGLQHRLLICRRIEQKRHQRSLRRVPKTGRESAAAMPAVRALNMPPGVGTKTASKEA